MRIVLPNVYYTANKHKFGLFHVDGEMVHFKPITDSIYRLNSVFVEVH